MWWGKKEKKGERATSFPEHFLVTSTVHKSQLGLPSSSKIWTSTSGRWHNLAPLTFHSTLLGAVTPAPGGKQPPYCSPHRYKLGAHRSIHPSSLPAWAGPKTKPRRYPRTGNTGCNSRGRVLVYTAPRFPPQQAAEQADGTCEGSSGVRHLSGTLPATPVCCRCYSPAAGSLLLRPLLLPLPQDRVFLSPAEGKYSGTHQAPAFPSPTSRDRSCIPKCAEGRRSPFYLGWAALPGPIAGLPRPGGPGEAQVTPAGRMNDLPGKAQAWRRWGGEKRRRGETARPAPPLSVAADTQNRSG